MKLVAAAFAWIGVIGLSGMATAAPPPKTASTPASTIMFTPPNEFGTAIDTLAAQHQAAAGGAPGGAFGAPDNMMALSPEALANAPDPLTTSRDPLDFRLPNGMNGIVDDAGVNFSGMYARWRELTRTDEPTTLAIIVAGVALMAYLIVRRRRRRSARR